MTDRGARHDAIRLPVAAMLGTPCLLAAVVALVPVILAGALLRDLAHGLKPGFAIVALDMVEVAVAVWLVAPVAVAAHRAALGAEPVLSLREPVRPEPFGAGPDRAGPEADYGAELGSARVLRWTLVTVPLVWLVLLPPDLVALAAGQAPTGEIAVVALGRVALAMAVAALLPALARVALDQRPAFRRVWRAGRGRRMLGVLRCAATVAPAFVLYLAGVWTGDALGGAGGAMIRTLAAAAAAAIGTAALAGEAAALCRELAIRNDEGEGRPSGTPREEEREAP